MTRTKSRIFKFARSLSRFVHEIKMWVKPAAYFGIGGLFWAYAGVSLPLVLMSMFGVYAATGGWRFVRVIIKTLPRDLRGGRFLAQSKRMMKKYQDEDMTIPKLFQETCRRCPNKVAMIQVDGKEWTFREIDEFSNAIANYLHGQGYRKGDVVALFMENCVEFVCLWLGMAKIGVVGALINFNLVKESLAHCIKAANAETVIFSVEKAEAMKEALPHLPGETKFYCHGDTKTDLFPCQHINPLLKESSTMPPPKEHVTKFNETLFYIYTSGTTGLPKAAIVIHSRFFYMTSSTHFFFYMNENDVIYDTLPLYHTAGGVLGVGQCFLKGCTLVVRKKFSASRFWDDCIKYNCTVAQYIGEICRYLLAQPQKPVDRQHQVRMCFGNGLKPQIWEEFKDRFGIERIGEFYGATEGNANIINIDNTSGAVGFMTRIAPWAYPVTLIRVDEDTGEPVRDRNGMCIKCEPGEPGQLVGKIIKGDPLREFDGYVNKDATSKKVASNVFRRGDSAFLTGDILVMDEYGYMYFRDRTGDTFRWRGENVSTSEVEAVISNVIQLNDATVYGVEVPGVEGRAGMAAIVDVDDSIDIQQLNRELQKALPAYARPMFLRKVKEVDVTGTFKLKKTDYRKEGIDVNKIKDTVYYLDLKANEYKPLDKAALEAIRSGQLRF